MAREESLRHQLEFASRVLKLERKLKQRSHGPPSYARAIRIAAQEHFERPVDKVEFYKTPGDEGRIGRVQERKGRQCAFATSDESGQKVAIIFQAE